MVKLKYNTNPEATSSFMPYDGPTPTEGSYNARIKNPTLKTARGGNPYLNALFELENNTGAAKQFNGFPTWGMVHFVSEHDNVLARWNSFIRAVGGKVTESGEIVHASEDDLTTSKGSAVSSVAGAKVDGKLVRVTLKVEKSEEYGDRLKVEMVSPIKDSNPAEEVDENDEVEVEVESDEDDAEEMTFEEREAELKKFSLPDLRAAAKEAGINTSGLKKAELVAAILAWEYEDDEESDSDDTEDEEEVEVEVEVEDEESDDDEEEDEDPEDEEEEEEDVDDYAAALAELADLDRTALKKRLKELDESAKVLKSMTDDDLRSKIADLSTKPPF